jgi:hypothetical protein
MKKALLAVFAVLLIAASAYLAYAGASSANLSGAQEVGGGDPDGSGLASVNFSPATNSLCVAITVDKISTPTSITINNGAPGTNGTVVATFQTSDSGCITTDPALGKDIRQHPESYYVNVLNADYPNGAIRGQLAH